MSALKSLILKYCSKNKKLAVSVATVALIAVVEILSTYVQKEIDKVHYAYETTKTNELQITQLYKTTDRLENAINNNLSMESFRTYLNRKDKEYEEQAQFNALMSGEVRNLDGRVDILEHIVYTLNDFELKKESKNAPTQPN